MLCLDFTPSCNSSPFLFGKGARGLGHERISTKCFIIIFVKDKVCSLQVKFTIEFFYVCSFYL